MCSEPAATVAEAAPPRCLLCSVGCPVRARRAGPDAWAPDYVPHAGYAGLCGRGSVLVELLDHPDRLRDAVRRDAGGALERLPAEEAMARAAAALREARRAAVLVDGNYDLDTLAAVGRLAQAAGARWAVHVPPGDAGLVRSLDRADCALVPPDGAGQARAVLAVGDVFTTHPVAAHWVFEARDRTPRMPLLYLGDACGVTAGFATDRFQPPLRVGAAARALAAVRTGDPGDLGPEAARLAAWKPLLQGADAVLLVSAGLGFRDALALGAEAARLAEAVAGRVCPLTTYGNAWGAVRAADAGGAVAPEALAADPADVLLVIGIDLEAALGRSAAGAAMAAASSLLFIGSMPCETSRRAGLVVPAALAAETGGRVLFDPGRETTVSPLLPPPRGVPTVRELVAMVGVDAATPADVTRPASAPAPAAAPAAPAGGDGLALAPAGDAVHFADGGLTRQAAWPQVVRPRPVLTLDPAAAEAAGLTDGGRAVVEGPGGSAEADVAVCGAQRPGQARLSGAFAEARAVFGWSAQAGGEPARVRVRRA